MLIILGWGGAGSDAISVMCYRLEKTLSFFGRQRMKVTGSEGRKFMLLSLNCHLMFMQSETVSESDRRFVCSAQTLHKDKLELIKPAALLI